MPTLRGLLSDIAPPSNAPATTIFVYDEDYGYASQSGGACCLFTVPDGATSVTFELWGAGGSGHGGNCMWPVQSGQSGGYSIRTIQTSAGCQYTVCAGGSGRACCCTCAGGPGCNSFVIGSGIATTCANGGAGGCGQCYSTNAVICYNYCVNTAAGAGDMVFSSNSNAILGYGCYHRKFEVANPSSWQTAAGGYGGSIQCGVCRSGCERGRPSFPGGSGLAGTSCSCRRCGGPGAAGMVKITYS